MTGTEGREDLQLLQDRTGLSEMDIVHRAIALCEFINAPRQAGNDLLVRDQETERLSFSGSHDEELGFENRPAAPPCPGR